MDEPRPQGPEASGGGGFIGRGEQPLLSLKLIANPGVVSRVYSAQYPNGQEVIVKQLYAYQSKSETAALSHFKNEAAILRRLEQAGVPGVPRLHNAVIAEAVPANTYLVMDRAEGISDEFEIRDAIRHEDPLKVEEAALRITKAIAETITAAYKAGVDYADLKGYLARNIFVKTDSYTVTIIDWGLAKLGEPKKDSNALSISWVSGQLGALLNVISAGFSSAYDKEGKLTASASKALAALSPGTRKILARAFYTNQGRDYRSGDELIHDLDEALQHISDPFVPASIGEIDQIFPQQVKTPEQQFREKCQERIKEIQDDPAIPEILRPTVRNLVSTFRELLGMSPKHWSNAYNSIDAVVDPAALPEQIRTGVYEPIGFMVEYLRKLRAQPDSSRREQQLAALGLPQSSAIAEYLLFGENAPQESLRRIEEFFRENMATIRELSLTVPQVLQQFVPADKIVAAPPTPIAEQEVAVVPESRVQAKAMQDMARHILRVARAIIRENYLNRTPKGTNFAWTVFGTKTDIGRGSLASVSAIDLHDVAETGTKSSLKELDRRIAQITDPKIREEAIISRETSAGTLGINFGEISDLPLRQLYGDSVPSKLVNLFAERLGFTGPGEWVDDVNNPKLERGRNEFRLAHPDKPFTLILTIQGMTKYGRPDIRSFIVRYTTK